MNSINVEFKYFITKIVKFILTISVFVLIFWVLILNYLDSSKTNDVNTYAIIVSRLSIFYLGSIITMSVYIYTKRYSMSTIQFSSPVTSITMGFGVLFSFLSIFLLPNKLYDFSNLLKEYFDLIILWIPKIHILSTEVVSLNVFSIGIASLCSIISIVIFPSRIFDFPILSQIRFVLIKISDINFNWQMFISFFNLLSFTIATFIFVLTLWRFIRSFHIDNILNKNYIEVLRFSQIKENSKSRRRKGNVLTNKDMKNLIKNLDIYNQNLLYLLTLKNEKLTGKYLIKWEETIISIQNKLFQSPLNEKLSKDLYLKTLDLTNQLIIETSDNISLKLYNDSLLTTIFNSIPLLDEEVEEEDLRHTKTMYIQNYNFLSKICYIELNKIINYLYKKDSHNNILYRMSNNEISFIDSTINQTRFITEQIDNQKNYPNYIEDLLIGILFNVINTNNNSDLPVILSLLFSAQETQENKNTENTNSTQTIETNGESLKNFFSKVSGVIKENIDEIVPPTNAKTTNNQIPLIDATKKANRFDNIRLNEKTISFLIMAVIKANEIENYKAVGYLVKRLCNHLSFDEIMDKMNVIEEHIYVNAYRELLLSRISLNDYSLKYCFNKTKILFFLQHFFNNQEEYIDKIYFINELDYKKEIISSLTGKDKEYNLSCIKEKMLDKILSQANGDSTNSIGFRVDN